MDRLDQLVLTFYKNERTPIMMNDQGGAFGFDIHHALEVDYLIHAYECDAIIETGTFLGDTTKYLSEMYPHLPIISIESNVDFFNASKRKLSNCKNVTLLNESSDLVIKKVSKQFKRPFFYLDAHWFSPSSFPIYGELKNIKKGIVCIGDFFIGDGNAQGFYFLENYDYFLVVYSRDDFDGVVMDRDFVNKYAKPSTKLYVNNAINTKVYPLPCHQWKRRSGRGYFAVGIEEDRFKDCNFFRVPTYDLSY